jgi:hypothetical protein
VTGQAYARSGSPGYPGGPGVYPPYYPSQHYGYPYYGYPYYWYPYYGHTHFGFGWGGYGFGVSVGFGYPWYGYPGFYGYGYPGVYPYGYPAYFGGGTYVASAGIDGAVRLRVSPIDATVHVDGYHAGRVEDFDGTFQRLHLDPGPHRIEIRKDGYESLFFDVNILPDRTVNYTGELKRP